MTEYIALGLIDERLATNPWLSGGNRTIRARFSCRLRPARAASGRYAKSASRCTPWAAPPVDPATSFGVNDMARQTRPLIMRPAMK